MLRKLLKSVMVLACGLGPVFGFAQELSKTFNELGAPKDPLRLGGTHAIYTIKVPAAPRESVLGASLHLETINSTALIKSRSELSIRVNGEILGQYALDPVDTRKAIDLKIPPNLLITGYNEVAVGVVQHYTYDCEDDGSPELWTEIDPLKSNITFDVAGQFANHNPKLTQLDLAFDKRGWLPKTLVVVFAENNVSQAELNAAAIAVQGFSLRMGFRPLKIEVITGQSSRRINPDTNSLFPELDTAALSGKDVLLVGDIAKLSPYISGSIREAIKASNGAFVAVYPDQQGGSVVTVISSADPREAKKNLIWAAKSLANLDYKYTDASVAEAILQEPSLPKKYVAKVRQDEYFSSFGYSTTYSRGLKLQPITFQFVAPADYGAKNGDKVRIGLHFSYGAGIRKDSSMNVLLNGQFATAVPLNEEKGGEFNNFEIKLPAEYVRPGINTIVFEPVFLAYKDRCDMHRDEHLILTIFEDSTLELPKESVPVRVPDLKRMAQGFWPYHEKINVIQTTQDGRVASSVLNLMVLLSQKNRAPLDVVVDTVFDHQPAFLIGTELTSPIQNGGSANSRALQAWSDKIGTFKKYSWVARGNHAGIFQTNNEGQPLTVFWADNPDTLEKATFALARNGLWDDMQGQAAIIDVQSNLMTIDMPSVQKEIASSDKWLSQLNLNQPTFLLYTIIAGIIIFAIAFVSVLKNRAIRRQRAMQDTELLEDNE